jgi:hypothetical protein
MAEKFLKNAKTTYAAWSRVLPNPLVASSEIILGVFRSFGSTLNGIAEVLY